MVKRRDTGSPPLLGDNVARAVLDAAPDGTLVVDDQGMIVFANPQTEVVTGYSVGELVGRSVDDLVPPARRAVHRAHRDLYSAHPRTRSMGAALDLTVLRRDGSEIAVEISLAPLTFEDHAYGIASVRDVTARRAAQRELVVAHDALVVAADRERIARDLHDTVIQRLFAIGLALQAAASRPPDALRERVHAAVEDLDETIRELRTAVFGLGPTRGEGGLRDEVLVVASEASRILGFEPTVKFGGPLDARVPDDLRLHVSAVLREALSNVARHAAASGVDVEVQVTGNELRVRVKDDGLGISLDHRRGNGLDNIETRARDLGGRSSISAGTGGGTVVTWWVPLC